jgi:hypothetical protein
MIAAELCRAADKQAHLAAAVRGLQHEVPRLTDELGRVLSHAAATAAWLQTAAD